MGSIELPYIKTDPKIIFFTDFDGTITLKDSGSFFINSPWSSQLLIQFLQPMITW